MPMTTFVSGRHKGVLGLSCRSISALSRAYSPSKVSKSRAPTWAATPRCSRHSLPAASISGSAADLEWRLRPRARQRLRWRLSPAHRAIYPPSCSTNSTINKIADLKGKVIAVSTTGSLSDWLAKQMAIQEGWGQDGIRAVPLGAIPTSIAALKTKQVDAVVLATEAGFRLEEQKEGRVFATLDRYAPHFITHVVFAQRSVIANNPGLVSRFLQGFFAAIAFVKTHKEETSSLAERVLQHSPSLARKVYDLEAGMFIDDGRFEALAVATLKQSFIDMKTLQRCRRTPNCSQRNSCRSNGSKKAEETMPPGRRQSQRYALTSRA